MKKMKTAELLNSAIYSNWKTVKKIHEAIIQIIYGLIMSAASWILNWILRKEQNYFQILVVFSLEFYLFWSHKVLSAIRNF